VKSRLVALGGGAIVACLLLACRSASPVVESVAPVQASSLAGPSPSLRPPVWASAMIAGEVPVLPEPPSYQPVRPAGVTLGGVSGDPSGVDSAGQRPPLLEPPAPSHAPSAEAQYALIERVAAAGERSPGTGKAGPPRGTKGTALVTTPPAARTEGALAPTSGTDSKGALPQAKAPTAKLPSVSSAPAGGAQVAAATSAVLKTAPPANVPGAREVLARVGDPIEIAFDGRGWLYLGLSAEQPGRSTGVSFQGGGSSGARSVFGFKALELGQYTLRFQLQDNLAAGLREEAVRLSVLPEEEFSARLERQRETASPASAVAGGVRPDPDRIAAAERLFTMGEYDRAVAAFLDAYQEGDAYLNERIAASYTATGDHLAAAKYYRRNLQAGEPFASQAVAGLVRTAVATADTALLLEQFPALLRSQQVDIGRELLEVGRSQLAAGRYAVAQEALREYLRRYPEGREVDEICYLLAQLLEAESPFRDLQGARDLYQRVYEDFPESPLAASAQTRRNYLNRYFFQVR
jgi:tetratricopeptide (TPR) repeat protein